MIDNFITEFDKNYIVLRNIKSKKIDVSNEEWVIYNPKIFKKNNYQTKDSILLKTNFDFKRIKSLYSNLSSLNFYELFKLKQNYNKLNYSTVEIDLQLLKLISYPVYLLLMSLFSALIMLRIKRFDNSTFKISIGLFISVIIYYFNNFFYVMGSTERLTIATSIFVPILILSIINSFMLIKINEK